MSVTSDRIRGRPVEIEVGEAPGIGWIAVGVVREGLGPERGLRFQVIAPTREEAVRRLQGEIEAQFA